jgi:hypothetical protein
MNEQTYIAAAMDSRNAPTYKVIEVTSGHTVRKNIKSLHAAHRAADKLDSNYGAVNYIVRREA